MRPVTVEHIVSQYFAEMPTEGVAPSWTPNTPGWYVRLYGNYQPFGHAGMDFKCPIGTPVHAIADGVVVWADWGYNLPGTGNIRKWLFYKNFPGILTVIQHDGWLSAYAHLSDNDAAPAGTKVKAGQLIGLSGDTGGVAAHLHVEALVDLTYKTAGGLIYGRTDPRKFFGSAAIAPQGDITETPETKKESEMPVSQRVDSKFKARHRLPKGKAYLLSVADDGTSANFAVNQVGHYVIHNYVRGEGLLPGQKIKAQFLIAKDGKTSGHFEQDIVGTIDGTFNQVIHFDRPVEAGTTLTCKLTSVNTETAYVTGFGAEVTTWKA